MILDRLIKFFTSVRLTVVLLGLGVVLVFWGTLAQVHLGLYKTQNEFFRSFFVFWQPEGSNWNIPVFPGGYLIGGLLLINLFAAHTRYYRPEKRKIGIVLIHLGIVMLLLGQLLTDYLARESTMHLRNGQTKNYSEAIRKYELAIIDTTSPDSDMVVAIPDRLLEKGRVIHNPELPFGVRAAVYYPNSDLTQKATNGYEEVQEADGAPSGIWWRQLPRVTDMDHRDMPSGIVELTTAQGTVGSFLVSTFLESPQQFSYAGHSYQVILRPERYYMPFSIHLVKFTHDRYAGTEIPKNFSSRIRLQDYRTGEDREVLIKMNEPLRYKGETCYQASFDPDDHGSILQVVHNPSWLTPYFACIMVGVGLMVQFGMHLFKFATKRRTV